VRIQGLSTAQPDKLQVGNNMSNILTLEELAEVVESYLEAAGWLVSSHAGKPEYDDVGYDGDHREGPFSDGAYNHGIESVEEFVTIVGEDDIRTYLATEGTAQLGHDLWLTRNGHGTGFWDRGLGDLGDRLSNAARTLGEADSWVHDDDDETVEVE